MGWTRVHGAGVERARVTMCDVWAYLLGRFDLRREGRRGCVWVCGGCALPVQGATKLFGCSLPDRLVHTSWLASGSPWLPS